MTERPAQSRECELSLLSTLISFPDKITRVIGILRPGDFYDSRNALIFQAISDLRASTNATTVMDWLTTRNLQIESGGIDTLVEITSAVPSPSNVDTFSSIIAERSCIRAIQSTCLTAYHDGFQWQGRDVADYAASTMEKIRTISTHRKDHSAIHGASSIVDLVADNVLNGKETHPGVTTGFARLDRIIGGFRPGELSILAARPSMGKSALMMNIAANVAASGKHVLIISLEDTRFVLIQRMLSRYANVPYRDIRLAKVDADGYFRVIQARDRIRTLPLHIDDTQGRTTAHIREAVQSAQECGSVDLVMIDHMHRITDPGESETHRYSAIVTRLADMAAQGSIPVLLLAQLSRGVEQRQDKRPELSDLRQSGTIEEVARLVLLLYRGAYYNKDLSASLEGELNIAKASQGETGMVQLNMGLSTMYVREWDESSDGTFRYIRSSGGNEDVVGRGKMRGQDIKNNNQIRIAHEEY